MPLFLLSVFLQAALVIHIIKTGRSTTWIWIVVMLPLAGSLAYFFLEVLPELRTSKAGRNVSRNLEQIANPDKDLKQATQDYSEVETVDNAIRLGEACLKRNMFEEAAQMFEKCLTGIHAHDPYIMYGKARAEFGLNHFAEVKVILDELIEKNPDFKHADAHLLYARTAEALDDFPLAIQEYEVLDGYYPGPEASYRYAMLLLKQGDKAKARNLLEAILSKSEKLGDHYNELHGEWIKRARKEYNAG